MKLRIRSFFTIITAISAVFLLSVTAVAVCTDHRPDGGEVTLEPSCELIGVITYTCRNEGCGYTFTEKLGNLGHCYVDSVCANCGGCEEGYVLEAPLPEESQPEEMSATLSKFPAAESLVQEPEPAPITIAPKAEIPGESAVMTAAVSPQTSDLTLFNCLLLALTLVCGVSAILLGRRLAHR